jgi:hypothetical protein
MHPQIVVFLVFWAIVVGAVWAATRRHRRLRLGVLGLAGLFGIVILLSATGWALQTS